MVLVNRLMRWGGMRVARRLSKSVPYVGAVIAVATIGATMRRKGLIRGALDAGLNATPFVGAAKLALESARGRDLIPDRTQRVARTTDVPPPASA